MVLVIIIISAIVAGIAVNAVESFFVRVFGFAFSSKLKFSSIFVFGGLLAGIVWSFLGK